MFRENGVQEDDIGHEAMITWGPWKNSENCKHACSRKQRVAGTEQQEKEGKYERRTVMSQLEKRNTLLNNKLFMLFPHQHYVDKVILMLSLLQTCQRKITFFM